MKAIVVGAGLAGCEAALQLAKRDVEVELYEMRPIKQTGAHKTDMPAEFVCSNSLGAKEPSNASGLLKTEMEILDCELLKIAKEVQTPAGNALAIERVEFSKKVKQKIEEYNSIKYIQKEIVKIPKDVPVIIAVDDVPEEQPANMGEISVAIPTETPDLGQPMEDKTETIPTFQSFGEMPTEGTTASELSVEPSSEQITVPINQFSTEEIQPGSYQASSQSEMVPEPQPIASSVPETDQIVDKPKKGKGLKVALIFLTIMIIGMIAGFVIWTLAH